MNEKSFLLNIIVFTFYLIVKYNKKIKRPVCNIGEAFRRNSFALSYTNILPIQALNVKIYDNSVKNEILPKKIK